MTQTLNPHPQESKAKARVRPSHLKPEVQDQAARVRDVWDCHWKSMSDARFQALFCRLSKKPRWFRAPFSCGPREEMQFFGSVLGDLRGKNVLEFGSGIGWTSIALARAGASVTVADISDQALGLSRRAFARAGCTATWVQCSIFEPPEQLTTYDIVFNSGLIEHFHRPDQIRLLQNMRHLTRPGGHVVAFAPYEGGHLYQWAKRKMEHRGTWKFGDEFPLTSMAGFCEEVGLELVREETSKPGSQLEFVHGVSRTLAWMMKGVYLATLADLTPLWRWGIGDSMLATAFRKV